MSRSNASFTENSLMDCFGAVQAALSSLPDDALNIQSYSDGGVAEAFMVADPVLASLSKQRLEAGAHFKKQVRNGGFDDAMVEVIAAQRAAIEEAYATRLAALRRRRGEAKGRKPVQDASNDDELKLQGITHKTTQDRLWKQREEERLLQIRNEDQRKQKRRNDTLWLWMLLILSSFGNVAYQQRPALRPV